MTARPAGGDRPAPSWEILTREGVPVTGTALAPKQNKPAASCARPCAWAKPPSPWPSSIARTVQRRPLGSRTGGARRRIFRRPLRHRVADLERLRLGGSGPADPPPALRPRRRPLPPCSWEEAFAEIGRELKALDPKSVVFYTSGRGSLEASYMYGLLARLLRQLQSPDSSNLCHEPTSVALPKSIGSRWDRIAEDFEHKCSDLLFFSAECRFRTPPGCCIRCRRQGAGAPESSSSTPCASAVWSGSPTRNPPSRCSLDPRPRSPRSIIR